MNVFVKLPIVVRVDNVEVIVMAGNIDVTSHTKHADIMSMSLWKME